jgi:large subunit ribosomal protein L17
MRHRLGNKKLGRRVQHRLSMLKNQVVSVLKHSKINTTEAKAKETRRMLEKVIRLASEDNAHRRRLAARIVREPKVLKKLFHEIGPEYKDRKGGYTRILKMGKRHGDNADMVVLELVSNEE